MSAADNITMRAPCRCGEPLGRVEERGGQACVFCSACGAFQYNAPKAETGAVTRSVSSRPDIKASQKARILERDACRCVMCGAPAGRVNLHVGHILSVDDGRALGATPAELYDDSNLVSMCEECNLGQGARSLAPRVALRLVRAVQLRTDVMNRRKSG